MGGTIILAPKRNCKNCLGKGWLRVIHPELPVAQHREVQPCHCVGAFVKDWPEPDTFAYQAIPGKET